MQVTIKTPEEIEKMRVAGRLAAEVLEMLDEHVKPGITTEELDDPHDPQPLPPPPSPRSG